MNVAIRTDAAPHIGLGHFMRCLTLAGAMRARGARTRFLSRHLSAHLHDLVRDQGHELTLLSTPDDETERDLSHSHWLGTSQHADARATSVALAPEECDWIIVDHYALDARWEAAVRRTARVMVIDDTADRRHECDVLLDQNLFPDMASRYDSLVPERCRLLLGPRYSLLREEFARMRESIRLRSDGVRRLLVLLGGTDARNETEKAIRAIAALPVSGIAVDVVIGADHGARTKITELCDQYGFACHVQVAYVAELMARADLAIGATGSTSWERCCLGLPTICVTSASNQVPIAEGLAATGAIINVGDAAVVSTENLSAIILRLIENRAELMTMSEAALQIVDGRGLDRVCEALGAA